MTAHAKGQKTQKKNPQEDLLVAFAFCFLNHPPCKIRGKNYVLRGSQREKLWIFLLYFFILIFFSVLAEWFFNCFFCFERDPILFVSPFISFLASSFGMFHGMDLGFSKCDKAFLTCHYLCIKEEPIHKQTQYEHAYLI